MTQIESVEEALCLIIGKADRGFYKEFDPQQMCLEILEIANQAYRIINEKLTEWPPNTSKM